MDISIVRTKYQDIVDNGAKLEKYLEFEKDLISSDTDEYLNFHYDIIGSRKKENLYKYIRACYKNRKNKEKASSFLIEKYSQGIEDVILRADVIQILGSLKNNEIKDIIKSEISSPIRDIRYRCIIVMGWVGSNVSDLDILNERMLNDDDGQLRGYAATAMRQIWHTKKSIKNRVTKYIKAAIDNENDNEALTGMIITIQEIHKKKLGIKESNYGDVSGDVQEAKIKAIKMLDKLK